MFFQRLPLETTYNTRELGGFPAKNHVTKNHLFLRSDDIGDLSGNDVTFLKSYGLTTIIDLRSAREVENKLSPFVDIFDYHNIPLATNGQADVTQIDMTNFKLDEFYIDCLENSQSEIKQIFQIFAENKGTILFHCAAGKDRTGVIAALLLGGMEVNKGDIIANYQVTNAYLMENPNSLMQQMSHPSHLMHSDPDTMLKMINHIHHKYGTIVDYLLDIGVQQEQLLRIRNKFVTEYAKVNELSVS